MTISFKTIIQVAFVFFAMWVVTGCGEEKGHYHGDEYHVHGEDDHSHDHDHAHDHGEEAHSHDHGGHGHNHGAGGHTHDHTLKDGMSRFSFLNMNGEFKMNPNDSMTQNDPRNPSRLLLSTSDEKGTVTSMTFYAHDDMDKVLATCGYQFIGSRPDPHYFPGESKTSIWDVFEKVEDFTGDCSPYKYVISRSPHGDPIHMHLRYGDDVEALLANSNAEEDENFNPWWSTYCDIDRTTSCD